LVLAMAPFRGWAGKSTLNRCIGWDANVRLVTHTQTRSADSSGRVRAFVPSMPATTIGD
jgi:hypothetical protein